MPCMKSIYRDKKGVGPLVSSQEQRALLVLSINRSSTGYFRTCLAWKGVSRPPVQPFINRLPTASLVSPSVYIEFRSFVLQQRWSGDLSSIPWKARGPLVSWANCSVGVPPCPAPPRCPAGRPEPTRPWYVRVVDSTGRVLSVLIWCGLFTALWTSQTWTIFSLSNTT